MQGLYSAHAYAVLRVAEVNGKRFVVLRNPWGRSEWTGPWSDGSKEWTAEWLQALPKLGHTFGDDGQFVMECECLHCSSRGPDSVCIDKDFLRYFTDIDRVLLFDDSWTVASCWLEVPITPIPSPPAYGLLSCKLTSSFSGLKPAENSSRLVKVTVPKKTKAVFALSRLNERSFKSLGDSIAVNFEFAVVKRGELHPIATASPCRPFTREASLELSLDQGEYLVYVKLEQRRMLDPSTDYADWDNVPYRSYPNITNVSLVSRSVACKRR